MGRNEQGLAFDGSTLTEDDFAFEVEAIGHEDGVATVVPEADIAEGMTAGRTERMGSIMAEAEGVRVNGKKRIDESRQYRGILRRRGGRGAVRRCHQ